MDILLAEDDNKAADFVRRTLLDAGHAVRHATNGEAALRMGLEVAPDVAVLDRTMPRLDGIDVLRRWREAGVSSPVLMLTALGGVDDRVEGLLAGADDYLPKPFHAAELVARVAALGRRRAGGEEPLALRVHDLELDVVGRRVVRAGREIALKPKEYAVLEMLVRHAGRAVTKTMLLEKVWHFHFDPGTTVVETHVSRLRAAVDKPFDADLIHTLRHEGYAIRAPGTMPDAPSLPPIV